jgi:hypothetical protein
VAVPNVDPEDAISGLIVGLDDRLIRVVLAKPLDRLAQGVQVFLSSVELPFDSG